MVKKRELKLVGCVVYAVHSHTHTHSLARDINWLQHNHNHNSISHDVISGARQFICTLYEVATGKI
jgi:hypothetical protein